MQGEKGELEAEIFDLAGRIVRRLSGKGSLSWNGRDSHNIPCAAGTYFTRIFTKDKTATAKIIKL
jgi:hypothetical protein